MDIINYKATQSSCHSSATSSISNSYSVSSSDEASSSSSTDSVRSRRNSASNVSSGASQSFRQAIKRGETAALIHSLWQIADWGVDVFLKLVIGAASCAVANASASVYATNNPTSTTANTTSAGSVSVSSNTTSAGSVSVSSKEDVEAPSGKDDIVNSGSIDIDDKDDISCHALSVAVLGPIVELIMDLTLEKRSNNTSISISVLLSTAYSITDYETLPFTSSPTSSPT